MSTRTCARLVVFGLLLVAVGVAVKEAGRQVAPERLRESLRRELAAATGADVSVRSARLDLKGVLTAEDVTLTVPGRQEPFFSCPKLLVALDKLDLLRLRRTVERIVLVSPRVALTYLPGEGVWDLPRPPASEGGAPGEAPRLPSQGVAIEDATLVVRNERLFGDGEPRTYPGLRLSLKPSEKEAPEWQVDGTVTAGGFAGTRISGWVTAAGRPQYVFEVASSRVQADGELWQQVPYGGAIWKEYQVEGHLTLAATVRSARDGSVDYSFRIAVSEGRAKTKYAPVRFESVNGMVEVTPAAVILKDVTAAIPAEEFGGASGQGLSAQVRLNGVAHLGGKGGLFEIEAAELPVCRATIEAIPGAGQELWRRLAPTGRSRLLLTLTRPAGSGKMRFTAITELEGATLRPRELPVPLEQVSGTVIVTNEGVRLRNVRGVVGAGLRGVGAEARTAPFAVDGLVDFQGEGSAVTVEVRNLRTDEALVKAIPKVGADIWERFRPEVTLDGSVLLRDVVGPRPTWYSAVLEVHGGRSLMTLPLGRRGAQDGANQPPGLVLPLERVTGTVAVDQDAVRFGNVRGVVPQEEAEAAPASFTADGVLALRDGETTLAITLRNVKTTERILRSLPGGGDRVWELFRPEVLADASLLLREASGSGGMSYSAVLELHGGRAEPQFCALPMADTVGTIRMDQDGVFIEHFAATVDTGGTFGQDAQSVSTVELRGTVDLKAEQAELYVVARDLMVTKNVLTAIPEVGEQVWREATPEGTASLSGKVTYDARQDRPLRYMLDVDLRDVSLLPRFLPLPVDAVSGELLVTERRAVSNRFEGVSCGGHFEGAAVVYYGPRGEVPSYGARLRFDQLELGDLVQHISGRQKDLAGRLSGVIDVGGVLGEPSVTGGAGSAALTEGRLWQTPFFAKLLGVLHLTVPSDREVPMRGDMAFSLVGNELAVREFELVGGGLNLTGYGTVWLDGKLELTMVAVGAPESSRGIPVLSHAVGWLLQAVERQLVRLDVSGTLDEPVFKLEVLSKITWPLTSLRSVLFLGSE
jgi:hypothetical protein